MQSIKTCPCLQVSRCWLNPLSRPVDLKTLRPFCEEDFTLCPRYRAHISIIEAEKGAIS